MAKPILVLRLYSPIGPNRIDMSDLQKIEQLTKDKTGNEYHVIVIHEIGSEKVLIECFNDCKGLPDIDIEKLIKDYSR